MRILLAAHQGSSVGGIGTVARGLAAHLPAAVAPSDTVRVEMPAEAHGGPGRFLYEQLRLARTAREYDLVHLCDLRPLLRSSTPFLITVHDVDFLDHPERLPRGARAYKEWMLKAALRKGPAAIVCDSEHTRGRLSEHFPSAAQIIRVIHPGVDAGPAAAWVGGTDPAYLLSVSEIIPRKNHLGFLTAFREARRQGLEADWLIAGRRGPLSREIVRELEAEPGVRMLGEVDAERLDPLYRDALCVVTPSLDEGFGFAPLEAMARGVPTLSSNAGSLPEVVGEAGPTLPPGHTAAWTSALLELTADSVALRELSEKGREQAARFSWQRTVDAIVDLYGNLNDRIPNF